MDNSLAKLIRENPDQDFDVDAPLPSGNVLHANLGPLINGKRTCRAGFEREPSEEDKTAARLVIDATMGREPEGAEVLEGQDEYDAGIAEIRRRRGGGSG